MLNTHRRRIVAGAGIALAAVVAVPALALQAAPASKAPVVAAAAATKNQKPSYPPKPPKAVSCKLSAVSGASKLAIDVDPNLPGSSNYTFRIDKQDTSGSWVSKAVFRTQGSKETRTIDFPKGKYRAECYGTEYGYANAFSGSAQLKK